MGNHSGTHVPNFALRRVLKDGADQRGSLVAAERLRSGTVTVTVTVTVTCELVLISLSSDSTSPISAP